jgi:hypothetical protein
VRTLNLVGAVVAVVAVDIVVIDALIADAG